MAERHGADGRSDRPAAAATGDPTDWVRAGEELASFTLATFADLAASPGRGEVPVVLDVRTDSERAAAYVKDSVHIPVHRLPACLDGVPEGTVWVHCGSGMRAATAASILDATGRRVVVDDSFDVAVDAGLTSTGCLTS